MDSKVTQIASKAQLRMSFLRIALFTVPAIVLLGTLVSTLSNSGYSNAWFRSLDLPSFIPPGWAFPVAWTLLYICLGLSLAMLIHARGARGRGLALVLFVAQLAVNYAWSPVFFGAQQVTLGLVLIGVMILLTLALLPLLWRIRTAAAMLVLPYLVWLFFAAALNYRVMVDNPAAAELAPGGSSTDIPID